jgi:hypothetical protein
LIFRSRCALRLGCPQEADNSTLASRKEFFTTRRSRQKTIGFNLPPAGGKSAQVVLRDDFVWFRAVRGAK